MNDERAAAETKWCNIEVERCIVVVLLGQHGGDTTPLSEKVECELCVRQELIPEVVG